MATNHINNCTNKTCTVKSLSPVVTVSPTLVPHSFTTNNLLYTCTDQSWSSTWTLRTYISTEPEQLCTYPRIFNILYSIRELTECHLTQPLCCNDMESLCSIAIGCNSRVPSWTTWMSKVHLLLPGDSLDTLKNSNIERMSLTTTGWPIFTFIHLSSLRWMHFPLQLIIGKIVCAWCKYACF